MTKAPVTTQVRLQHSECSPESEFAFLCAQVFPALRWYKEEGYDPVCPEQYMEGKFSPDMSREALLEATERVRGNVKEIALFTALDYAPYKDDYGMISLAAPVVCEMLLPDIEKMQAKVASDPTSFQIFPRYNLYMTRFGPGGTYDAGNPD